jgi:hypothetical protein
MIFLHNLRAASSAKIRTNPPRLVNHRQQRKPHSFMTAKVVVSLDASLQEIQMGIKKGIDQETFCVADISDLQASDYCTAKAAIIWTCDIDIVIRFCSHPFHVDIH